ncbi:MAG: YbaK/EbsC family protein [Alphaproteobacteria bacterium]|nr:YbaK/EbsC family protein [Alphaproteobacteria bacterium]
MSASKPRRGVERVRAALLAAGHPDTVVAVPAGAHTAADAAAAVGCELAQIVKSLIFRHGDRPVLVLASGVNRVDQDKLAALLGGPVTRADPGWVREMTGFTVGGVAPLGFPTQPPTLLDADLAKRDPLWAAAGSPEHVFRTTAAELARITGAQVVELRQQ